VTIRDKDFGAVRLRAFGIYSYRLTDPKTFHREVSGTREVYTVEDLDGQLRNSMIAAMTNAFGASGVPFLDMAGNQGAFAAAVKKEADGMFARLGLTLDTLVVENISLPEEIQKMLDTRIGMNMIGDMQRYTQFQTANAIPIAAANEGGGLAAMGANLAAGVGIGNQMAGAMMGAMTQGAPAAATVVTPGAAPAPAAAAATSIDEITATLEKLHALVGKGILSQAEFDTKKAELLAKLG
jgi:membrane protease subunit (stomatin/prohibitin family)